MKFFIFLFILVWSNLKAQNLSFKYGSETLEFETDTVEFKINPIRGNTQVGSWHKANEFALFLLDDFDQNVQMCQISSKKNALFQFTGKKYEQYLLESMGISNHFMISVMAGNLGREIVLMFHGSQLGIVKEKKLIYKKLKKPQTVGYFWRKRFKIWLDDDNIVVPLDHYKIPDSIRSNYPLFGIFPDNGKPKVKLSNTFGYIPKEIQKHKFNFDQRGDKIITYYTNTAVQVFSLKGEQLMYLPGVNDTTVKMLGYCQYFPEKDLYVYRYQKVTKEDWYKSQEKFKNFKGTSGKLTFDSPYFVKVIKNTKNPEIVYEGIDENSNMPFSHRATNEYYEVLDYDGGDTLKVVLYHLK